MSEQRSAAIRRTYLVEHYRPGFTEVDLERAVARVREAVGELEREGHAVRFRHSTIVATDESILCVVEASTEELVRLAYARANVPFDRISAASSDR